jgi:hypothetical protein
MLKSGQYACVVCGQPLSRYFVAQENDPYPCCAQVACRMVLDQRASMGDVLFKSHLARQLQQKQKQAANNLLTQRRNERELEENRKAWSLLQASAPPGSALTRQVVLPSGPRQSVKLSRLRRKRYREHLRQTIAKALEANEALPALPRVEPMPSKLPGHLCAACGGGCCTLGGDHAYLSRATLQRFMAAHPEMSVAEVVEAYMARLARRTQYQSCINHTEHGCSLSREMRSDICNNYICEPLAALEQTQRSAQPVQTVLVVRRKLDNWMQAAPGLDNRIVALAQLTEAGVQDKSELMVPHLA